MIHHLFVQWIFQDCKKNSCLWIFVMWTFYHLALNRVFLPALLLLKTSPIWVPVKKFWVHIISFGCCVYDFPWKTYNVMDDAGEFDSPWERVWVANSAIAAARKTGSLIPSWPQYLARHYQPPNRWGPWIRHPRWQSQINTIHAVDLLHYCHRWRLFQIQTLKKHGKEQGWIKSRLLSRTPPA